MVEYVLLNGATAIRHAAQRAVLFAQDLDWKAVVGISVVAIFLAFAMKPGTRH
jgi:hypothetical protein